MKSNITFYTTKVTDREEWIEASAGIYGEEFREQTIRYLNSFDILAQDFDFIFICDNFGEVVGRCIVAPYREAIFGFIIDSRYRHKGYGKKMVTKAVEFAREKGIKILPLCPFAKSVFDKTPEFRDVL